MKSTDRVNVKAFFEFELRNIKEETVCFYILKIFLKKFNFFFFLNLLFNIFKLFWYVKIKNYFLKIKIIILKLKTF
jgi:hypothetical protein